MKIMGNNGVESDNQGINFEMLVDGVWFNNDGESIDI